MKLAIICFSLTGCATAEKLKQNFGSQTDQLEIRLAKKSRYIPDAEPVDVDTWTKEQFAWADGIIFVGACGIAVRHIAPYLVSKKKDPAVLVIDECGKFVISLLSGHLGGANELAEQAAQILGAIPVVTTATDLHHCFAVDVFAKKNHCEILNLPAAKEVSAALLAGKEVGFYSDFPVEGELPQGLVYCDVQGRPIGKEVTQTVHKWEAAEDITIEKLKKKILKSKAADSFREKHLHKKRANESTLEIGIAVTNEKNKKPFPVTTVIVPRNIVLGMGCRKEKDAEGILAAALAALEQSGIYLQAVAKLTSIDLKKEEKGLLALAKRLQIPFETFSEEELRQVKGTFSASPFVQNVTGVDNVCERSAVLGSHYGTLIQKKTGRDGVTTALAAAEWRSYFE